MSVEATLVLTRIAPVRAQARERRATACRTRATILEQVADEGAIVALPVVPALELLEEGDEGVVARRSVPRAGHLDPCCITHAAFGGDDRPMHKRWELLNSSQVERV